MISKVLTVCYFGLGVLWYVSHVLYELLVFLKIPSRVSIVFNELIKQHVRQFHTPIMRLYYRIASGKIYCLFTSYYTIR